MIKIDLITGFLGSGKTTFIRKYAKYLCGRGEKICILENDFGAVNVDMMLLQDLLGDNCDLEMVSGAYDKDCHKRRFKTKLISMAMAGFDRVLIEPSGIYDVDEFFDTLREEPLDRWYEIGNVIAVCDSEIDEDMSKNSRYMMQSQIANAGCIILSRCQETDAEKIQKTVSYLLRMQGELDCRSDEKKQIIQKDWDRLGAKDWEEIFQCGYSLSDYEKMWLDEKGAFDSLYFMNINMPTELLKIRIEKLLTDENCGKILRIKGFMQTGGRWIEFNATHKKVVIKPIEKGQEVFIVIGEGLDEGKIKAYWEN